MSDEQTVMVEVHSRVTRQIQAVVTGDANPARIIKSISDHLKNELPYAFSIAMPGPAPDSIENRRFDRAGKSLDGRSFHVSQKETGEASLTLSENHGKTWILVGVFTGREWAESIGTLWKSGALNVDFTKIQNGA